MEQPGGGRWRCTPEALDAGVPSEVVVEAVVLLHYDNYVFDHRRGTGRRLYSLRESGRCDKQHKYRCNSTTLPGIHRAVVECYSWLKYRSGPCGIVSRWRVAYGFT